MRDLLEAVTSAINVEWHRMPTDPPALDTGGPLDEVIGQAKAIAATLPAEKERAALMSLGELRRSLAILTAGPARLAPLRFAPQNGLDLPLVTAAAHHPNPGASGVGRQGGTGDGNPSLAKLLILMETALPAGRHDDENHVLVSLNGHDYVVTSVEEQRGRGILRGRFRGKDE